MNRSLAWLLIATFGTASAHSGVTVVSPTPNLAVSAPNAVVLRFGDPINLRFTSFRVMAMPPGKTPAEAAKVALALKADSPQLVNTGPLLSGMAAQLSLKLNPNLKAGQYLIAWSVLSEDGHPVIGHSLFRVR